jgi:Phosphotransferase enzyme family
MSDRRSATEALAADRLAHPAARAWLAAGGEPRVDRIESLRRGRHCRVDRLVIREADGRSVIAKWQDRPFAFEKRIQQEILPSVGLPSLEVFGEWTDSDERSFWIFFEDAGDVRFRPSDDDDRALVARWLAALHAWPWLAVDRDGLPDRGPAGYFAHLHSARGTMAACVREGRLRDASRIALNDLLRQFDRLEEQWPRIEAWCAAAPRTLVHGDLADKNARIRPRSASRDLLVFDWEMAGIGVPCVDLAQATFGSLSPDLDVYRVDARGWPPAALDDLGRFAAVGKVFRLLAAIDWEARSLPFDWCDGGEFWPFPAWLRKARRGAELL